MDMPTDEDMLVPAPSLAEVVRDKLRDASTPAFLAEFDPEEAALAGAFVEDALTLDEALDSAADLAAEA
jgi:hypothetical protein